MEDFWIYSHTTFLFISWCFLAHSSQGLLQIEKLLGIIILGPTCGVCKWQHGCKVKTQYRGANLEKEIYIYLYI
jgi:hypothetical protein